MNLSQAMTGKLNAQITSEFNASSIYLAMACMYEDLGLKVLAEHFREQSDEERGHGLKIVKYLNDVGAPVRLQQIPAPPADFGGVVGAIEAALKHEQMVTQQIHDLVGLAEQEKDFTTREFLQWFVDEQVEEESSTNDLLQAAKTARENWLQLEMYLKKVLSKE